MFSAIRRRVTYANVAVTLALVFAMSGGAYAAGHYLITSTKQISPKVLKALKGKSGSNGANGANGPTGPAGPAGTAGSGGSQGPAGATGATGAPGAKGATGTEGSPWTAGGTLPSERSEYGQWALSATVPGGFEATPFVLLSFPIPLSESLIQAGRVIGPEEGEGEAKESVFIKSRECGGTVTKPSAKAGHLCIFEAEIEDLQGVQT